MAEPEKDNPIYRRDEILQVLYWMTNEGFGEAFSASDLQKFLESNDAVLSENLDLMVFEGFLESASENKYALTDFGKSEGGRRFADEFEEMMKPGHYECADPDCDCNSAEFVGECKHLSQTANLN